MTSATTTERSSFSIWMQAVRPFAFPASIVPVMVGAMWAVGHHPGEVYWFLMPVIVVAAVLFHAGTNLVSEYFDLRKGVDRPETFGSSRALVDGLLKPKAVLYAGLATFAVGFLLGLIIVSYIGMQIFWIGVIGLLGGIFYTGTPIGYKYFALGDAFVFMLMGPLMVIGTYLSLTGILDWSLFWVSFPVGCLVAAILIGNNIRDIKHDKQAKIKTIALLLGTEKAKFEYYILVIGAFVSVGVMVILKIVPVYTLLVLLSIKPVIDNIKLVSKADENNPEAVLMADIRTAQHHLLFGILYSIGILIGALV